MPRDVSGQYTLPPGLNPVIDGTTITSMWANTTLEDVASALTNSLSRNGQGGMLAPLRFEDGTVGLPGAAFSNEPSSGMWRAGTDDVRFSVGGVQAARLQPAIATLPGNLVLSNAAAEITASTGSLSLIAAGALNITSVVGNITIASVSQIFNPSANFDVNAGGAILLDAEALNITTTNASTFNTNMTIGASGRLNLGVASGPGRLNVQQVAGDTSIAIFHNQVGTAILQITPTLVNMVPAGNIQLVPTGSGSQILLTSAANGNVKLRAANGVATVDVTSLNRLLLDVPQQASGAGLIAGQVWADTSAGTPYTLRIVAK